MLWNICLPGVAREPDQTREIGSRVTSLLDLNGGRVNLDHELLIAIIDAFEAHQSMSKQALDSEKVRQGLRSILLGPGQLWESLRQQAE